MHSISRAGLHGRRGTHVVLIAPLVVDWELPFNAHFRQEETALGEELARERALVESYGISARRQIVRARPGEIGRAVADVARDTHASLIVVGATVASTRRLSPALLAGCAGRFSTTRRAP